MHFTVIQQNGITKIENHSDYELHIYMRPVKPKRKFFLVRVVNANEFVIYDDRLGNPIELSEYSFELHKIEVSR